MHILKLMHEETSRNDEFHVFFRFTRLLIAPVALIDELFALIQNNNNRRVAREREMWEE